MAYDARGNFVRVHNWEQDRLNSIEIASDRHDEEDDNFAAGLSLCVVRDGRAAMTGNLKMDGYRVTGMGAGTASTDAVNKSQLDTKQNTITGAATTITGSNLTASRALVSNSNGKVAVSAVTATELGYLDGVTSAIQTQLNNRITAAFSNGVSGYWKDSKNNFLINRGRDQVTTNVFQITFPEPFKSTNYSFVGISTDNRSSGYSYDAITGVTDRQKTYIKIYSYYGNTNIDWIAAGY
ncbi:MAG: hypothetical protein IKR92_02365 [Alphaproteobacteria bacterium]|nr:hypothetical protein [Alphaproteobacteria bacterium]